MGATTRARGTRATVWPAMSRLTTGTGSIRPWATARQQRSTRAENEACNWLGQSMSIEALEM